MVTLDPAPAVPAVVPLLFAAPALADVLPPCGRTSESISPEVQATMHKAATKVWTDTKRTVFLLPPQACRITSIEHGNVARQAVLSRVRTVDAEIAAFVSRVEFSPARRRRPHAQDGSKALIASYIARPSTM